MIEKQAEKFRHMVTHSIKAMLRYKFAKVNAKWFREHYHYTVLEDLTKVSCPVLAITGDKDFQADLQKLHRLPALVKGELTCHEIQNMDHGLKRHEGPMAALNCKEEYRKKANEPIHAEAISILSSWLNAHYVTG